MKNKMKLLFILLTAIILTSCSTQRKCYPSKGSRDYAIKPGTIKENGFKQTTLISVSRTMRGFKHLFVTDSKDTIVRYYNLKLKVDSCYYIAI